MQEVAYTATSLRRCKQTVSAQSKRETCQIQRTAAQRSHIWLACLRQVSTHEVNIWQARQSVLQDILLPGDYILASFAVQSSKQLNASQLLEGVHQAADKAVHRQALS